jgi:hypothetical protein
MPAIKPYDPKHNYVEDLTKNEISEKGDDQFVYLRGLLRIAHERGIKRTNSRVVQAPSKDHPVAVVTYGYEFEDGAYFEASADAHSKNVKESMVPYLTANAEARAKARALRDAFRISLCSVEEIGSVETTNEENDPIDDSQIQGIQVVAKRKGLTVKDALALISKTDVEISELSKTEGRTLMKKLNEFKKK